MLVFLVRLNLFHEYDNITNDYHRLEHEYNIYADNVLFLKKIIEHKQFYIDDAIIMKEKFDIPIEDDFENLTVKLFLHCVNRLGHGNIILEIPEKDNFIDIIYLNKSIDFNLINKNSDNISSNLEKINTNETDIASNLTEINLIKKDTTELKSNKTYLKNLENILFYNERTQIDFNNLFYQKVFDIDASINDFIEMNFKISLETDSISLISYVKTIYQILDENNNSLYIKSINIDQYKYFSKYVFIDEYIFHNFNKNIKSIKFIIKFEQIATRVIKMYYLKNDNYRLIFKHYSM